MGSVSYMDSQKLCSFLEKNHENFEELSDKIDEICPKLVPLGAIALFRSILLRAKRGNKQSSYTELCRVLSISRTTMASYLHALEDAKILKIRRRRTGKENATNAFEIDFTGPLGGFMSKLNLPKSAKIYPLRPAKTDDDSESSKELGVVQKLDGYISNNNILTKVSRAAPRVGFDTVRDAIAATEKRVAEKRQAKVEKQNNAPTRKAGGHLTFAGVKATWATAMLKHYPTVPVVVITAKDFAILKGKLAPVLAVASLGEFFDWVVGSWEPLRATKFAWLTKSGKFLAPSPSLPEMMRYWKIFAQAFSDSRMLEATGAKLATTTEAEVTTRELQEAKAQAAQAKADMARMEKRLSNAERAAYGSRTDNTKQKLPLSERTRQLDEEPDDGSLPVWCDE